MSSIADVLVAALAGSLTGGYAGYAVARTRMHQLVPAAEVGQREADKRAADQLAVAQIAAERTAALAGLELLGEVSALLGAISREHKHYSDSEGRCPLGLAPELSTELSARGDDLGRFLATMGPLLAGETHEALAQVNETLPGVLGPLFSPPAPLKPNGRNGIRHHGARRDPETLCAFRHAAIDANLKCQASIDKLRSGLYAAAESSRGI